MLTHNNINKKIFEISIKIFLFLIELTQIQIYFYFERSEISFNN